MSHHGIPRHHRSTRKRAHSAAHNGNDIGHGNNKRDQASPPEDQHRNGDQSDLPSATGPPNSDDQHPNHQPLTKVVATILDPPGTQSQPQKPTDIVSGLTKVVDPVTNIIPSATSLLSLLPHPPAVTSSPSGTSLTDTATIAGTLTSGTSNSTWTNGTMTSTNATTTAPHSSLVNHPATSSGAVHSSVVMPSIHNAAFAIPYLNSMPSSSSTSKTSNPMTNTSFFNSTATSSSTISSSQSGTSTTGSSAAGVGGVGPTATGNSPQSSPSDTSSQDSGPSPTTNKIVGGVVGSVAGIAFIFLLALLYYRRRRMSQSQTCERLPSGGTGGTAGEGVISHPGEMTSTRDSLFPASYFAPAFMRRWRQSNQTTNTDSTLVSSPSERGFQKIAGRKIPSVLQSGGDGYGGGFGENSPTGTEMSANFQPGSPSNLRSPTFPPPTITQGVPLDGDHPRESQESVPRVIAHPSPNRSPFASSANIATTPPGSSNDLQGALTPASPRGPDPLGRSHPSFDGSRSSRFTEGL